MLHEFSPESRPSLAKSLADTRVGHLHRVLLCHKTTKYYTIFLKQIFNIIDISMWK